MRFFMEEILVALSQLTENEEYGDFEKFKVSFSNADKVISAVGEFETFYRTGEEVLLYKGNKAMYSCSYEEYKGQITIYAIWGENGRVDFEMGV